MQPAGRRLQPFQPAHVGIGTLVDAGAAGRLDQAGDDGVAPLVGAGRGQLHDDGVAVLVGDDAGQAVRFGVDQAQPLLAAQFRQRLTARHGGGDAALEEGVIDRLVGIEGPEAGADLRFRAVRRAAQRPQVVGQHLDGIARPGTAFEAADGAGEHPRVALLERGAFLTRHEYQLSHVFPTSNEKPRLPCGNRGPTKLWRLRRPVPCGCVRGIRQRR